MLRLKKTVHPSSANEEPTPDAAARNRAAEAIREAANSQPTLFERAERLRGRAERLEEEGTPSDSARNRAERAENEVAVELANFRASLSTAGNSTEDQLAFDQEVRTRYPYLALP